MKHVLTVAVIITGFMALSIFLLWYYLVPHKHPILRRAEMGDAQAMYDMGVAHLSISGKGILDAKSSREPVFWFRKAAKGGHSAAMYMLADLDIPNEEKVMWLKKGAGMGNGACVAELAKGYTHGLYGLRPDPVEAFRWVKVGWQMDFMERGYDHQKQSEEMGRLLARHRSHLRISLTQQGKKIHEIEMIMTQIQ